MQVAQTILQQLGGRRFMAMTGAKQFVGSENALTFALPSNFAANKANRVRVTLDASDTYTVTFFNIRGLNVREISTHAGIYADNLAATVSEETGLALSL